MENRQQYAEDDPRHHTIKIKGMLNDTRNHLREDVGKVEDPTNTATVRRQRSGTLRTL